jgi:protein-disulfide isomerase
VDGGRFAACLSAPGTAAILARDITDGAAVRIMGTPTFYVWGPWGERWIRVRGGPEEVLWVLDTARAGGPLPVPQQTDEG